MRPGTLVWAARPGKDAPEVDSALVLHTTPLEVVVDRPLLGARRHQARDLHATRTAALLALTERLEESAREDRKLAAQFVTRADRSLIQALLAKRMAEAGR